MSGMVKGIKKIAHLERIGVIQMTLVMLDGSRYQSLWRPL
jgi:hypothetical protein